MSNRALVSRLRGAHSSEEAEGTRAVARWASRVLVSASPLNELFGATY